MARITSKQAKELMEAYASVHNVQERFNPNKYDITKPQGGLSNKEYAALGDSERRGLDRASKNYLRNNPDAYTKIEKPDGTTLEKGDKGFEKAVDQGKDTVTKAVNSSLGKGSSNNNQPTNNNNQQSTQSNNNKQSTPTKDTSQGQLDAKSTHNTGGVPQAAANIDKIASTGPGSGSVKVDGKALMNKLKADSGDRVQSSGQPQGGQTQSGGQQPQSGVNRSQTVEKSTDGGTTTTRTTTRTSADNSTPEGAAAVKDFKANREARLNRLRSGGGLRPDGQGPSTGGTPPSTQGGAQKPVAQNNNQAAQKPGALGRLGSLAGRAANAARNAAGGIKQVATSTASNIKKGAQAVSGALANKGPIQGRASGPQRRAQQAVQKAQPAQQPQQKSGLSFKDAIKGGQNMGVTRPQPTAKPVATQQAAAKPAPRLSGAQQAQQMAKDRIAAGRNTVTGKLKSEKPKPKVTTWREMEGYDPMENLFDDTVQFLVSEGHAKDKSEAISIMSESEFVDAFNQELNE